MKPRENHLSWDDYYMAVAIASSGRSKDPSTQVGAAVVSPDKKIVGIGYNGFPRGCRQDDFPWDREADSPLRTKYPFTVHAEMNSVLNAHTPDLPGCTIYTVLFPCSVCARVIIQTGIREVVYLSDKHADQDDYKAARMLFEAVGVKCRRYAPSHAKVVIDLRSGIAEIE